MKLLSAILFALVITEGTPVFAASVCILNKSGQELFLVVDDLAQNRIAQTTPNGGKLCLEAGEDTQKSMVGVFADSDAQEGCSRLTKPDQTETLTGFEEFDRCSWRQTPREFPEAGSD